MRATAGRVGPPRTGCPGRAPAGGLPAPAAEADVVERGPEAMCAAGHRHDPSEASTASTAVPSSWPLQPRSTARRAPRRGLELRSSAQHEPEPGRVRAARPRALRTADSVRGRWRKGERGGCPDGAAGQHRGHGSDLRRRSRAGARSRWTRAERCAAVSVAAARTDWESMIAVDNCLARPTPPSGRLCRIAIQTVRIHPRLP
jgi:hypothetical protein